MNTRQITSDVVSRLAKIRQGVVYNSITSVVSELLQNCQRAKAKTIHCFIKDNYLTIIDDGVGCKDPDELFTIDRSAWDSTNEGFGEGFTSVYTVADIIKVRSHKWSVNLNVAKMLQERNLTYSYKEETDYSQGFEVTIQGEKIEENIEEITNFLKYSASLLPMNCYVNNTLVFKKDLSNIDGTTDFIKTFDNKLYTAYLTPLEWGYDCMVYYENREVCKEWLTGVSGNIILKQNAGNLKAPDRKAIINDGKYRNFKDQLEKDTKKLYREFIKLADNNLIDEFSHPIASILNVKEYEDLLEIDDDMFKVHVNDEDEYINPKENKIKDEVLKPKLDIFNYNTDMYEQSYETEHSFPPTENYNQNTVLSAVKSINPRARKNSIVSIAKSNKLFWVSPNELNASKETITNMEYYGFKGIIAVNELYERVFNEYSVPHISYLVDNIKKQHKFTDIGTRTLKEKRALFLLRRIEEYYKIGETFNICNITMKIVSQFDDKELQSPDNIIEGVCTQGKIYLDRKSLKLGDFTVKNWTSEHISLEDLRFILRASDTISHELAHLLYDTKDNTLAHMQAQAKIAKEIGYLY